MSLCGSQRFNKKSVYTLRKRNIETEVLNCDLNMSTLGKENPSDASFRTVAFPIIFMCVCLFFLSVFCLVNHIIKGPNYFIIIFISLFFFTKSRMLKYLLNRFIPGAVACVTLLDRLQQDTLSCDVSMLKRWQVRPQNVVLRHIKKKLHITNGES